jgi:hypothetical protein
MIATHARLQRALPARARRAPKSPRVRPAAMPELPGRIQPGMGRADLARTLGVSRPASSAPGSRQFGALVPHTTTTRSTNRPNIVR